MGEVGIVNGASLSFARNTVSSGDVIIASKLASVDAEVSGIQVGRMRAGSQSITSITQRKTFTCLSYSNH